MSKYDFELDLEHENSLSLIIDMIRPNSEILEFGPANGRLTKYLNDKMHCKVDIVEIDDEAGKEASRYSQRSFLGKTMGDIEKFEWLKNINNKKYDHVIFADVLEHLHNPKTVLENCNKVLKEDGSIIMSVPNLAHNSVIIDLINDEFKYNKIGLLDNTHISFFTYKSLVRMIEECGYRTTIEKATYSKVGNNEIKNSYASVNREIEKNLRVRDKGNVYQYIFEVKKNKNIDDILKLKPINLDKNYELVCYIKESDDRKFVEDKSIKIPFNSDLNKLEINLTKFKDIKELRIDPIDTNCIIEIKSIYGIINDLKHNINILGTNGINIDENIFLFSSDDPQIYIDVKNAYIDNLVIEFKILDYNLNNMQEHELIVKQMIQKKENIIEEQNNIIKNNQKIIQEREKIIQEKLEYIDNMVNELESYKNKYNESIEYKNALDNKLKNITIMYNETINSMCWKITKPIRIFLDLIKRVNN
ncbi:hypothetical protein CBU02nite_14340 [Clostridium butyricum]|uniref:Methyltransferase domain-containing protein n=1 Tax=Clostridium butyricum TaxID=1492 RepID=A0A512TLR2_CLOBU|nr:class I SAM-dependent methyltransferase [Clostridium butyricum]NOW24160.1 2-polyprenyl-3-methyl-5-hydroxy-6-metoxy-1,4-benzoquinol methylase [Clostridium butyricum]GEQ20928.1 hypothetical protein CBU02nite_14340 [Clostridium butyricum]